MQAATPQQISLIDLPADATFFIDSDIYFRRDSLVSHYGELIDAAALDKCCNGHHYGRNVDLRAVDVQVIWPGCDVADVRDELRTHPRFAPAPRTPCLAIFSGTSSRVFVALLYEEEDYRGITYRMRRDLVTLIEYHKAILAPDLAIRFTAAREYLRGDKNAEPGSDARWRSEIGAALMPVLDEPRLFESQCRCLTMQQLLGLVSTAARSLAPAPL